MDHTHSTSIDNPILQKIIEGGGKIWPEVGALNVKAWQILLNVTDETVNTYLKKHKVPHKRAGSENWCRPADLWASLPFEGDNEEQPLRPDPRKKRGK